MQERSQRSPGSDVHVLPAHNACSIFFYEDLVVVDFDDPRAVVGDHLVKHLIHYTFILESCEIIDFFEVKGIDGIAGFIDTPDLYILGQVRPLLETVSVQHDIGFKAN
jgi:hypothetical protein